MTQILLSVLPVHHKCHCIVNILPKSSCEKLRYWNLFSYQSDALTVSHQQHQTTVTVTSVESVQSEEGETQQAIPTLILVVSEWQKKNTLQVQTV